MQLRVASLFAAALTVPLAMASAATVSVDRYDIKPFTTNGSAASRPQQGRYGVSVVDRSWFDRERDRGIPARVYFPTGATEPCPVIIFSTGLGRSREDCAYLGRHWASCGYVSVHVQHKGSDEEARQGVRPRKELQRAFYAPENIRNRPLDIIFVINQLEHGRATLGVPYDLTRIGVAGHDFGAQTVLALAGEVLPGKLSFRDPRVKAVVAMGSPVPLGQVPLEEAYRNISLPCLHITGTADNSIVATTTAQQRRLPFDYTSGADQFLVTFLGADHMTYSGHVRPANGTHDAMFQRLMAECSAVFWDAYLRDDASAQAWLAGPSLKQHLGGTARVEKKLAGTPLVKSPAAKKAESELQ